LQRSIVISVYDKSSQIRPFREDSSMAMASIPSVPTLKTLRSYLVAALLFFVTLAIGPPAGSAQETEPADRTVREPIPETTIEEAVSLHEEIIQRGAAEWMRGERIGKNSTKRAEWYYFQRRFPFAEIPAGARQEAMRQVEQMQRHLDDARALQKGASIQARTPWEPIGPENVGGRIRAMAVHPTTGSTIYIGAAAGGVWKSTNSGTSWRSGFDKLSALTIGALAIDPSNPQTVYAGTGELRPAVDVTFLSDGIFKSIDGGETWRNIGLKSVGAINKIEVHRNNPQIVYAATGRTNSSPNTMGTQAGANSGSGFYRTIDGGTNWTKTRDGSFYDMAVNPENSNEIFLVTGSGVLHSTDAGLTFSNSSTGMTISGGIRLSIAIAPSEPTRLYVLVARRQSGVTNNLADVYMTTNSGANWTLQKALGESLFAAQGDYNNCIAVSPSDASTLLVGGIDIYRSSDAGVNWRNVTNVYAVRNSALSHADQQIIVFDPSNPTTVYNGNDGGAYFSVDEGNTWARLSTALPITQFYTVEVDPTRQYRVFGGTQDNNTQGMFGVSAVTKSWTKLLDGDGFHVVIDKNDPNVLYAESQYGNMNRINVTSGAGQVRDIDGGISTAGYWSTPIAQSPVDGKLYSGRVKLWVASNPRANPVLWDSLTPGNNNYMSAVATSPSDAGKIIIGEIDGGIYYTTDAGETWARSTGTPTRFVTDLIYDPVDPKRVYATFSGFSTGHVYRSDDNGATFVDISANIPNIPVNAIEIDPDNPTHLFAGTDVGMFLSLDGGALWLPFNEAFPLTSVMALKIHKSTRTLFAATHGRSMWKITLDNPQPDPMLIAPMTGSTLFTPDTLDIRWAGLDGPVRIEISYDGGVTWVEIATDVTGTFFGYPVGLVRTSAAVVRVTEISTGRSVMSGLFSLSPETNGQKIGLRGFIAEAIEVRGTELWATTRTSDSLFRMRTPTLLGRSGVKMTGIPGKVRDLAYDSSTDLFYVLVAPASGAGARLFRMDTLGVATAEIPLSGLAAEALIGVAVVPDGVALIEPGATGRIFVIDPSSGAVRSTSQPLAGTSDQIRSGLVWDGLTFVQGVVTARDTNQYPSELQRIRDVDPPVIAERTPVILSGGERLYFYGLAVEQNKPVIEDRIYFATDTAGNFYRFTYRDIFSSQISSVPHFNPAPVGVTIGELSPNPTRLGSSLGFSMKRAGAVTIDLYNAAGEQVRRLAEGTFQAGDNRVSVDVSGLPSGVYNVSIVTPNGERAVRSLVVVR
jgi:photosystem II stability/assembly factor-like uncharacterized protein